MIPCDLEFATKAKYVFRFEIETSASPEESFAAFDNLDKWLPKFKAVRWLDAASCQVGAHRFLHVDQMRVNQTILSWQPGVRFAFTATSSNIPLMIQFMEDIHFKKLAPASTKITWTMSYASNFFMKCLHVPLRFYFNSFFSNEVKALKQYLDASSRHGR